MWGIHLRNARTDVRVDICGVQESNNITSAPGEISAGECEGLSLTHAGFKQIGCLARGQCFVAQAVMFGSFRFSQPSISNLMALNP